MPFDRPEGRRGRYFCGGARSCPVANARIDFLGRRFAAARLCWVFSILKTRHRRIFSTSNSNLSTSLRVEHFLLLHCWMPASRKCQRRQQEEQLLLRAAGCGRYCCTAVSHKGNQVKVEHTPRVSIYDNKLSSSTYDMI